MADSEKRKSTLTDDDLDAGIAMSKALSAMIALNVLGGVSPDDPDATHVGEQTAYFLAMIFAETLCRLYREGNFDPDHWETITDGIFEAAKTGIMSERQQMSTADKRAAAN